MKTKNVKRSKGPSPATKTKRTPKTVTFVADPENQVWLDKARAAGFDVNLLISRCIRMYMERRVAAEAPTNNDDPIVHLVISPNHPDGRWGVWTDDAGRYYILDVRIPLEEQNPPPVNLVTALQIAAEAVGSGCFDTSELPAMLRDASRALAAGGAR